MKTLTLAVAALAMAATAMFAPVYAQSADEELAAACKGKKSGDIVVIDGEEMACK